MPDLYEKKPYFLCSDIASDVEKQIDVWADSLKTKLKKFCL